MTFRQFAVNNVLRNIRLYAAYFLSSTFTVMVFFTFSVFMFHPALNGTDMNQNVAKGMMTAAIIIYVFSFFFVLYSMGSFLQSRKKEFGLLMMQGMSTGQIRTMVFLENMFIGFFATLGGITVGLVFTKFILLIAENILIISTALNFYIPWKAMMLTFGSFIVLFFIISISVSIVLRSKKLIHLIQGNKRSKGDPKTSRLLTVIAAVLLAGGYVTALVTRQMQVVIAMVPVVTIVVIGTYLLFTQLSVYVIRKLKNRKTLFWRKTNMILFSDLSFRMKDNARTFFLVAIISTVAFCSIGALYGFQSVLTSMAQGNQSLPFSYTAYEDNEDEREDIETISQTLSEHDLNATQEEISLRYYDVLDSEDTSMVISQSDYNRFAAITGEDSISVGDNGVIISHFEANINLGDQKEKELKELVTIDSEVSVHPEQNITSRALPEVDPYFIVSDEQFERLSEPEVAETYYGWQTKDDKQAKIEAGKELWEEVGPSLIAATDYEMFQLNKGYGPVLFVGLFIGIVFFVAAGSFLYFRLYSDLDDDKEKFQAIAKLGLSEKELKKVLTRQVAILFFTPMAVALLHGAVALTALSHLFMYNLFIEAVTVLGIFFVIQVIYFFIVRFFYIKQIKSGI
ncbi:putative ABC transport system permease protein [Salibacterium salarium]|uniref:ABC transporter permease n=1 Tax=Salibacterium salarium TaxID=284579 RepID=UPI002785756E|nr:ABC transporter permease [Salibacterium salarium]MDQ0300236.1 putative ABC transport system permease protein [Salibacterium salarium]